MGRAPDAVTYSETHVVTNPNRDSAHQKKAGTEAASRFTTATAHEPSLCPNPGTNVTGDLEKMSGQT